MTSPSSEIEMKFQMFIPGKLLVVVWDPMAFGPSRIQWTSSVIPSHPTTYVIKCMADHSWTDSGPNLGCL